ncbi:hypothetical protein ACOSP7_001258 [Xanthoceras sorbifolium]
MKGISDSLAAAGQVMTEQDLVLSVLSGLGVEYDPVVIYLTARQDLITLSEAQFLLLTQEQRLEQLNAASSIDISSASAHFTSSSDRKVQRGGNNSGRGGRGGRGKGGQRNRYVCDSSWYFDTGATNHVTPDHSNLGQKSEYKGNAKIAASLSSHTSTKWHSRT